MDELLERSIEEMQMRKKPLDEASIDVNLESKLQCLVTLHKSRSQLKFVQVPDEYIN